MRLRTSIPDISSPQLDAEWRANLELLERLNAGGKKSCMGLETREVLFKTCRVLGAKRVLDIGTYIGMSALNFALACGEGSLVTTLDVKNDHYIAAREREPHSLWTEAGVAHRIEWILRDSRAFLRSESREFDFICIDGWHDARGVYKDIVYSLDRIARGGLIFMDDVQPAGYEPPPGINVIDGPRIALYRVLANTPWLRFIPATACTGFLIAHQE